MTETSIFVGLDVHKKTIAVATVEGRASADVRFHGTITNTPEAIRSLLLGLPGDNTYSNYQEANRTFWRQTVIPLSVRVAKSLSAWLGQGLELRCDLDALDALAPDREALWARLDGAGFLTQDEKRAAAGYGPAGAAAKRSADLIEKFRPDQPRVPAGSGRESGRWIDGGGITQVADRPGYPINILEEDARGGQTFARHVGKSEEYLKARILGSRTNIARIFGYGRKRAGSFPSLEAANKLVNSTIAENSTAVEAFKSGTFPYSFPLLYVYKQFSSPTGYEAYSPDGNTPPVVQPTYGVAVRLTRDHSNPKGYYVHSAWPYNED